MPARDIDVSVDFSVTLFKSRVCKKTRISGTPLTELRVNDTPD